MQWWNDRNISYKAKLCLHGLICASLQPHILCKPLVNWYVGSNFIIKPSQCKHAEPTFLLGTLIRDRLRHDGCHGCYHGSGHGHGGGDERGQHPRRYPGYRDGADTGRDLGCALGGGALGLAHGGGRGCHWSDVCGGRGFFPGGALHEAEGKRIHSYKQASILERELS